MIVIYIMYYQGLTMTTCTCQACKNGPAYDNTTDQKTLYHREQHRKAVRKYKPNKKLVVPITRINTLIHEAYAPPVVTTETSAPPVETDETSAHPAGTFVPSTGTFVPPAETDETSAHPTGTF